jgi:hypothetical protein
LVAAEPTASGKAATEPQIDFRYAPTWWQTSICLPDDWQKTLVGKEGTLLYDFPGKHSGFKTRIGLDFGPQTKWLRQELVGPRVPIVRTVKQAGTVEIVEETFAVTAPLPFAAPKEKPAPQPFERVDGGGGNIDWAAPTVPCDPGFRNIAVAMNGTVQYRVRAAAGKHYTIVVGLCEGWHAKPAQRVLDLAIEGKARKTVDMIAEHGKNVPALYPFEACDENGDGWIDLNVAAANGSVDRNTILNVLWVFEGKAPAMSELLTGKSSRPALVHLTCGREKYRPGPPRYDVLLAELRNSGTTEARLNPVVTIDSEMPVSVDAAKWLVDIGGTLVQFTAKIEGSTQKGQTTVLRLASIPVQANAERIVAIGVLRGAPDHVEPFIFCTSRARSFLAKASEFWAKADLPYDRFEIPDPGVQALLDSSIRNIYQAREIKQGLPAFQVGPTCYRGLWVVDGSFLMESVAFLGRAQEARSGIQYLLSFQRPDGAIMLMDGHLKETGITLWAVTRHARLTGDKQWLAEVWPRIEKGLEYVRLLRRKADDPKAPTYRLMPEGFSDGGLGGINPEYTNVYWSLVGMKAAADAAEWLGRGEQAESWRREYDDYLATFRKAAERDARTDAHGNRYVPISMRPDSKLSPQKAQWAFLHAVFPGKLFAANDPLVTGNMAMLRAAEAEGLVRDTGWVASGLWNYFGSFYGHGWLWVGQGQKAAQTLYDFGNHASPLLVWREEQMPVGEGPANCGDMPHNWASAEFIRLVRHLLVLERGDELHLLEGLPKAWLRPGKCVRVREALTEFGPVSLELRVSEDGRKATLRLAPPVRNPAKRIVLHLDGWAAAPGRMELPATEKVEREITLAARTGNP